MSDDRNRNIVPADKSFFQDVFGYMKLVIRLMADSRVNPLLKVIPIGSIGYLLFPLDIPGPIDDLAIVGLAMYTFIQMCPQDVVDEHRLAIDAEYLPRTSQNPSQPQAKKENGDVIDAEFREE